MKPLKVLWRLIITPPPVYVLVLNTLLISSVVPAYGHLGETGKCFNVKKAKKVVKDQIIGSNGLLAEMYDTDGDSRADLVTLSHMHDGSLAHKSVPLFYLVDHDKDGQPDAIYIDKVGKGNCKDIVLYEDLTKPHDMGLNFKDQSQTQKGRAI